MWRRLVSYLNRLRFVLWVSLLALAGAAVWLAVNAKLIIVEIPVENIRFSGFIRHCPLFLFITAKIRRQICNRVAKLF